MKKVVFVDELNLTENLKRLLKENGIFVLEDLILYLPEFLQEQFDLTIEDWKSILEVFIENHCAPSNLNSTICAAIKKRDWPSNALLINVMDEKYIVSIIHKGKRLYNDYIYKSLVKGLVFLSKDDADSFAKMICKTNDSRIIEAKIENAQNRIYVKKIFIPQKNKCIISFDQHLTEETVLQEIEYGHNLFRPQKADTLARTAVDRINRIFDYDIAQVVCFTFDEDAAKLEETELDVPGVNDSDTETYISLQTYQSELQKLKDTGSDDYFVWGKNAALDDSKHCSLKSLGERLSKCKQAALDNEDDAGITDEDDSYLRGYIEGIYCAISIQKSCICNRMEANVVIIDQFDFLSGLAAGIETPDRSFSKGNCTIYIKHFSKLEEINGLCEDCQAFYLICDSQHMSREKEDEVWILQRQFYETYKKDLYVIPLSKTMSRKIMNTVFSDLFMSIDADEPKEQNEKETQ